MYFSITKKMDIYIYGAGSLGRKNAQFLKENGYNIKGYLDKNADSFSDNNIFKPNEIIPSENSAVIICVHNALWHYEISEILYRLGWDNILFVPYYNSPNKVAFKQMQKKYLQFQCLSQDAFVNIPQMSELKKPVVRDNDDIVFKTDKYVVALVDILLLFSSLSEQEIKKRGASVEALNYVGAPLIAMKPYIELFRYIENEEVGNTIDFLHVMKLLQDSFEISDEDFIADRYDLYYELTEKLNIGIEQFFYSPSPCFMNEKKQLQLIDGMSRAIFLFFRGYKYIPVLLSVEDYNKYYNSGACEKLLPLIRNNKYEFKYNIEHPLFRNIAVEYPAKTLQIIRVLAEYFDCNLFKRKTVLNNIDGFGALSRYFYRLGADVTEIIADKSLVVIEKHINELLFCPNIRIVSSDNSKYDIVCVESQPDSKIDYYKLLLEYLADKCNDFIVWVDNGINKKRTVSINKALSIDCIATYNGRNSFAINIVRKRVS